MIIASEANQPDAEDSEKERTEVFAAGLEALGWGDDSLLPEDKMTYPPHGGYRHGKRKKTLPR